MDKNFENRGQLINEAAMLFGALVFFESEDELNAVDQTLRDYKVKYERLKEIIAKGVTLEEIGGITQDDLDKFESLAHSKDRD